MNKARILVVDDQQEILESLEGILLDEGHEVILAHDGQEALHLVQSDSPDVVFLDIWIPGIDGMQTLKAIKRIAPDCSVIMMSGHGTIETAVKAIKLGATDYLEKPLNLEDVLHLVHTAVASRGDFDVSTTSNGTSLRLIGRSEKAERLRRALDNAARETGTVWLFGDEGTGKEFAARIVHYGSGKERSNLVKVRCSDLTEQNFAEVFLGRSGGSHNQRLGKIQQAHDGTLLLVRLDRLHESLRPRLNQLIQDAMGRGSNNGTGIRFRGRIISTSIANPQELIDRDDFPAELGEVLGERVIRVPSLHERPDDIPLFVDHFLSEAKDEFERDIAGADKDAMDRLVGYSWPGNVKELKILMEHVVMTAPGPIITAGDLLIPTKGASPDGKPESSSDSPALGLTARPAITVAESESPQRHTAGELTAPSVAVETGHRRQKTLRGKVVMYGKGLHSGVKTGLTLSPLPPGSGILFGNITEERNVPALLPNVESTEFCTALRGDGITARTIEHLMAVFHVYGLTNVLVKISGEVPIMDGSAVEFCRLVEGAEIISQDVPIEEIRVARPIEIPLDPKGTKSLRVEPSETFQVEYFLDYPHPIGRMHMVYTCEDPEDFKKNIAPARTFGFVRDMRMMDEMGLADGGRLSNVVLLDDDKVVNPPLRFPDEFVRHKILDIIGDFYLLGRPFRGKIIAKQTGHTDNISMLKLISENMAVV